MKGIILAGGLGQRLHPLTKVTNKHLLPVYDRPMIHYPLQTRVDAGIRDIMVVTGGNSAGDFLRLLGNGKQFGLQHIHYGYQEGEGGIAAALQEAQFFAGEDSLCILLGDNMGAFQASHGELDLYPALTVFLVSGHVWSDMEGCHAFLSFQVARTLGLSLGYRIRQGL